MAKVVDSQCTAFQAAIHVLGKPWNAMILTVLQAGPRRFSEIADVEHAPGDKILSARLKELEARGLIARTVEPGPPVRVSYALTAHGEAFGQVAVAIERWGRDLCAKSVTKSVPRSAPRRAKTRP
ncbi:MAG: helix-turn-helix transcriptional regulator [Myxococcota bacterium]|nr:helix-turn-helix transcriptional regulator [Myxococcota bacterium]